MEKYVPRIAAEERIAMQETENRKMPREVCGLNLYKDYFKTKDGDLDDLIFDPMPETKRQSER